MSQIWVMAVSVEEMNRRGKGTLSDHLGIVFTEVGDDYLAATMPVESKTMQPIGMLHGGATCVLAETVGSAAANYCVDQKLKVCVGLDININHVRAVRSGTVTGIAHPFHLGKSTQVWEIKVWNEQKLLVAVSRLTMAVIEKK